MSVRYLYVMLLVFCLQSAICMELTLEDLESQINTMTAKIVASINNAHELRPDQLPTFKDFDRCDAIIRKSDIAEAITAYIHNGKFSVDQQLLLQDTNIIEYLEQCKDTSNINAQGCPRANESQTTNISSLPSTSESRGSYWSSKFMVGCVIFGLVSAGFCAGFFFHGYAHSSIQ